jgi:hypothetical protein
MKLTLQAIEAKIDLTVLPVVVLRRMCHTPTLRPGKVVCGAVTLVILRNLLDISY